jgi:hypothetical protein
MAIVNVHRNIRTEIFLIHKLSTYTVEVNGDT